MRPLQVKPLHIADDVLVSAEHQTVSFGSRPAIIVCVADDARAVLGKDAMQGNSSLFPLFFQPDARTSKQRHMNARALPRAFPSISMKARQ